jgi:hypothetical protein
MGLLVLTALLSLIGVLLYEQDTQSAVEVAEIVGGVIAVLALVPPLVRRFQQGVGEPR